MLTTIYVKKNLLVYNGV